MFPPIWFITTSPLHTDFQNPAAGWTTSVSSWVKKEVEYLLSKVTRHKKVNRTLQASPTLSVTNGTFSPNYQDKDFSPPFYLGYENQLWSLKPVLKFILPCFSSCLPVSSRQQTINTVTTFTSFLLELVMGTIDGQMKTLWCYQKASLLILRG